MKIHTQGRQLQRREGVLNQSEADGVPLLSCCLENGTLSNKKVYRIYNTTKRKVNCT